MAGMLAARALSEHFERVTLLERDPLPSPAEQAEPTARKGVPQGKHTHGLLAGGLAALERFFPRITQDLIDRGSLVGDIVADSLWHVQGGFHARPKSGLIGTTQSRPLLESVVRERLSYLPGITIRDRVNVDGLISHDGCTVMGVELIDRRDYAVESLHADLVVDATGRGSRMPEWLAHHGFATPQEERVEVKLTYATQQFRRRPGDLDDVMAVVLTQLPPSQRFGVALAIEGDRWSVTLGGMFADMPPNTKAGFVEFARGLPTPELFNFLRTAEPISDVEVYKFPASQRRRYEKLRRFPQGLLVLGDALCSFNPVYGQGMSVAALEAELLDKLLGKGLDKLAPRFFRQAAKIVDVPWQIAVTADFQHAGVCGDRPWLTGPINRWMKLVHETAHRDPVVATAFHRVANLLDSPGSLFRPAIVTRVLRQWWRGSESPTEVTRPAAASAPLSAAPLSATTRFPSRATLGRNVWERANYLG
jgi:2-polyprenyl-6-methoxyphenol hydroxylase-like FAD-dependent oxidoreductase